MRILCRSFKRPAKRFFQVVLLACENQLVFLLKMLMKSLTESLIIIINDAPLSHPTRITTTQRETLYTWYNTKGDTLHLVQHKGRHFTLGTTQRETLYTWYNTKGDTLHLVQHKGRHYPWYNTKGDTLHLVQHKWRHFTLG